MMRRLSIVTAVVLALPASAVAAPRSYFPKPHHRCRTHYVRRLVKVAERKHGRTVVVRRAECAYVGTRPSTLSTTSSIPSTPGLPATPTTPTTPTIPAATGVVPTTTSVSIHKSMTTWFSVSGSVFSGGQELFAKPLTYTVTDATTGHQVATFGGPSGSYSSCTVVYSISGGVKTYTGQPVPPMVGCNLTSFSMPASDAAVVTATFAGDSTYAPSTSSQATFS